MDALLVCVCMCNYNAIDLFIYLSTCLSIYLSTYICLSIVSIYIYISTFVFMRSYIPREKKMCVCVCTFTCRRTNIRKSGKPKPGHVEGE